MKLFTNIFILTTILLLSQNIAANDLDDYAKKMRDEVWAWNKAEFKNYEVPEKYKGESAVILAHYQELKVGSRKVWGQSVLFSTTINREMVKINDRASLDDYSQISFNNFSKKGAAYGSKNIFKTVIGVRIIKPDGIIKEIDVNKEAISITEGKDKNEKEAYKKLAVSDIQIGDIIDYFICEFTETQAENIPLQLFRFYSSYPTLSYSVHCEICSKVPTVEYIVLNGAPDFIRSVNENGDYVLELTQKDLQRVERTRWTSPLRELPMIRMGIYNNKLWVIDKPSTIKKEGIYKVGSNLSTNEIFLNASIFRNFADKLTVGDNIRKDVIKEIKKHLKSNPNISTDQLTVYIHDLLYLRWPTNNEDLSPAHYISVFRGLLHEFNIPTETILMTNKYGPDKEHLFSSRDLDRAIMVNNRYYTYPYGMRIAGELYEDNEGEEARITEATELVKGKVKDVKLIEETYFSLPKSKAEQNVSDMTLDVSISDINSLETTIDRNASWSGALKTPHQNILATYQDWDKTMRHHLSIDMTLQEEMQKNKRAKKYIEEINAHFEKRQADQKDSIKTEIKYYHNIDAKEVIDYQITDIGVTPEKPALKYNTKYTIEGLLKKAGNNLILDAGKLVGDQWAPSEEERVRTVNAYLPTPRIYKYRIVIHIPEGYEVQGVENLNKEIDNKHGLFSSSAILKGNVLEIEARKEYKTSFIPTEDWRLLIEMLDKTNEFYTQSVLLNKI